MSKKSDDSAQIRWWSWLLFPGVIILWGISIILLPKWFLKLQRGGNLETRLGSSMRCFLDWLLQVLFVR